MSLTRTFETEKLAEFIAQLFTATGVYAYDATDCASRILEAEILGETEHGLASVGRHVEAASNGDIDPRAMVMTESETVAVAFLNGNQGVGHAAGTKAAGMAVEKAKAVGTGTIVVSNSQDFGSPAVYARLIALQGCVGYVTTSTGEKPTFTKMLGRHEFAWGIPSDSESCCLLKGASGKDSDTGLAYDAFSREFRRSREHSREASCRCTKLVAPASNEPNTTFMRLILDTSAAKRSFKSHF